ncbi:MAG TPA: uridine kinase [Micrococcaceae bacterium]|nr:uridine kinase [Micrococcaceae bacterium]
MHRFVPSTPAGLARLIGERALALEGRARVAVDGPAAADPLGLAQRTAQWLRQSGRPAAVVDLEDFVLPASVRLENGRDPQSFHSRWFDYAGLGREVLDPLGPGSASPFWLPRLRDAATDRSAREARQEAPPSLVLLVAGPMLLGRWLDFDLTVQLMMDGPVLTRRTAPDEQFTVPALIRYQDELDQQPDILVRYNHPERPAVMER